MLKFNKIHFLGVLLMVMLALKWLGYISLCSHHIVWIMIDIALLHAWLDKDYSSPSIWVCQGHEDSSCITQAMCHMLKLQVMWSRGQDIGHINFDQLFNVKRIFSILCLSYCYFINMYWTTLCMTECWMQHNINTSIFEHFNMIYLFLHILQSGRNIKWINSQLLYDLIESFASLIT